MRQKPLPKSQGPDKKEFKDLGKKIAANSIVGMITNCIYLLTRLAITPFILLYVPLEEYGLWTICFVILSYVGLSGFGINNSYIKYVAEFQSRDDMESINSLISTGLFCMSGLCLGIFIGLKISVPLLIETLSINPDLQALATFLIIGTAGVFLLDLSLGGFKSLLEGCQEIALVQVAKLVSTLIEAFLIVIFLYIGLGVTGLLYALIIRYLVGTAAYIYYAFRKVKGLKIQFGLIKKKSLRILLTFGGKMQVLGFIGIFMTTFDRIVTTAMLGLESTGRFEIGRKFPALSAGIFAAAFDSLLPAASFIGGHWEDSPKLNNYQKIIKYGNLSLLSVLLTLAMALPWFIFSWKKVHYDLSSPYFTAVLIICVTVFWPGIPLFHWFKRFILKSEHIVGQEIRQLYLQGCRYTNLVSFTLISFLIAIAPWLIFAWVGEGFKDSVRIMIIISISVLINLATGPGTSLIRGINRPGRELEYALINLTLAIMWIPGLAHIMDITGAALGTAVSTGIASVYFIYSTNRSFQISVKDYIENTVLPGIAPVASGIIIWGILFLVPFESRWLLVGVIFIAGIFYLFLTGLFFKSWVFSNKEWDIIKQNTMQLDLKIHK